MGIRLQPDDVLSSFQLCLGASRFDGVHVHTPPDMTAIVAAFYQLLGKKFVFDHHDLSPELYLARSSKQEPNFLYRVLRFFERFACRRADRLIATNTTQQKIQIERGGANPDHCYVVRNGPNESFLGHVEPNQVFDNRDVLSSVTSGLLEFKTEWIIWFASSMNSSTRIVATIFLAVIVGYGPALSELKQLAVDLDVEDKIVFTGKVLFPSVPEYIAAFDICLTPDPSNAYNDSCTTIKTMEYMALRKPTVCFRTKENEVTAGEAALYAPNNDVAAFTELVIQLMDNPALRERMGEIARQRIDQSLRWERQADELKKLYRELYDSGDLTTCRCHCRKTDRDQPSQLEQLNDVNVKQPFLFRDDVCHQKSAHGTWNESKNLEHQESDHHPHCPTCAVAGVTNHVAH